MVIFPGWAIFVLITSVVCAVVLRIGRVRREQMLSVLAHAVESGVPPAAVFQAMASESRAAWSANGLAASLLEMGTALPDVLAQVPGVVPRWALPLIRLGRHCGGLGAALQCALRDQADRMLLRQGIVFRMAYLVLVVGALLGCTGFLQITIYPVLSQILRGYGLGGDSGAQPLLQALLGALTTMIVLAFVVATIYVSVWLVASAAATVLRRAAGWRSDDASTAGMRFIETAVAVIAVVLAIVPLVVACVIADDGDLRSAKFLGVMLSLLVAAVSTGVLLYYLASASAGIGVAVPFPLNRLTKRRHTALLLDALSVAVERSCPVDQALACLQIEYPEPWIQWRLQLATRCIRDGADWTASLKAVGLIGAADSAVLSAAVRNGNLPWALRESAENHRRRFRTRAAVVCQVVFVSGLAVCGVWVAVAVASVFLPMTSLIRGLA